MQRQCCIQSATLRGMEAELVSVEVSIGAGIPGIWIVGMADTAVQEARERVKAAIRSSGFKMPDEKIIVNLAPGNLRKIGSGFDLPIALGILQASGQLDPERSRDMLVVGELSLEGRIREVVGMLAFELMARERGLGFVCAADAEGVLELPRLAVQAAKSLSDFREELDPMPYRIRTGRGEHFGDFGEVGGQEHAKRALQIAAAGKHGVLMVGPPGSGKTMLASRLPSILPELDEFERLQIAQIYSASGEDLGDIIAGQRPFRHPHHSISKVGLLGGGNPVRPGEVSLAHLGVCFLDELAEFPKSTLQGLRQPMEDGRISIVRAEGAFVFPARFMLVAATNPCPCGYYGDPDKPCTCAYADIAKYQGRIGGPLLDRIDLQIDVWRSKFDNVVRPGCGLGSRKLKEGVMQAREFRSWRESSDSSVPEHKGATQPEDLILRFSLEPQAEKLLRESAHAFFLSGRSIVRAMQVARTIADIAQSELVRAEHMGEALGFRLRGGGQ